MHWIIAFFMLVVWTTPIQVKDPNHNDPMLLTVLATCLGVIDLSLRIHLILEPTSDRLPSQAILLANTIEIFNQTIKRNFHHNDQTIINQEYQTIKKDFLMALMFLDHNEMIKLAQDIAEIKDKCISKASHQLGRTK